jgi:hypothetical protein
MAYTAIGSPLHSLPVSEYMPTLKDQVGGGTLEVRRTNTRTLKRWELVFPGMQDKLDPLSGFFEMIQGDTPFWFDGAGTLDLVEPILIAVGDGTTTVFRLPHRNVFVASAIIYLNGAATNNWTPSGAANDGVTMDNLIFSSPPGNYAQIRARYRRKAKVLVDTDSNVSRDRAFRDQRNAASSVYQSRVTLMEVPN